MKPKMNKRLLLRAISDRELDSNLLGETYVEEFKDANPEERKDRRLEDDANSYAIEILKAFRDGVIK